MTLSMSLSRYEVCPSKMNTQPAGFAAALTATECCGEALAKFPTNKNLLRVKSMLSVTFITSVGGPCPSVKNKGSGGAGCSCCYGSVVPPSVR